MTDSQLAAAFTALIADTQALQRLIDPDSSSEINVGAADADISAAESARQITFANEYRAFLRVADGWRQFTPGYFLFSTSESAASPTFEREVAEYDGEIAPELAGAVPIGRSENDAGLILLLPSGEVVEWLYEETARHADFHQFLKASFEQLRRWHEEISARRRQVEREQTPEFRAASDDEARVAIAALLAEAAPLPASNFELPLHETLPPWTNPTDLVKRVQDKIIAEVSLNLVLYLSACPSADEVRASWRAFRRRFPFKGPIKWAQAHEYAFLARQDDPDDESFLSNLTIDDAGYFGVRVALTAHEDRLAAFNLRGLPPAQSDGATEARASFLEVIVPPDADAESLAALAAELLAILPVRSGHGGYAVYFKNEDGAAAQVLEWCRRFVALDVGLVDGALPSMLTRLHPSSWLTILGRAFVAPLDAAHRLELKSATSLERIAGGVIVKASPAPTLGDHLRNEWPHSIGEIDRALWPLQLNSYRRSGSFSVGGVWFETQTTELPPFLFHALTRIHYQRYIDPRRYLGATPLEEAESLLSILGGAPLQDWIAYKTKEKAARFGDIGHYLAVGVVAAGVKGEAALRALELILENRTVVRPRSLVVQSMNNLLIGLSMAKEIERAMTWMPLALTMAKENCWIYHPAAGLFMAASDREQALQCIERARAANYPHMSVMTRDAEFISLHSEPRFIAATKSD